MEFNLATTAVSVNTSGMSGSSAVVATARLKQLALKDKPEYIHNLNVTKNGKCVGSWHDNYFNLFAQSTTNNPTDGI